MNPLLHWLGGAACPSWQLGQPSHVRNGTVTWLEIRPRKSELHYNNQLQLFGWLVVHEMCHEFEQGALQRIAGVEKEKEKKEIRDN